MFLSAALINSFLLFLHPIPMSFDDEKNYELRILFGPMYGVDLLLPKQESIFVFVGAETAKSQSASQFASNALVIPHHKSGINFRISFDAHISHSDIANKDDPLFDMEMSSQRSTDHDRDVNDDLLRFSVEWIKGNEVTVEEGVLNSICQFEDIAFAIRLNNTPWSDAVRQFLIKSTDENAAETSEVTADLLVPSGMGQRTRRFTALACIAVALLALPLRSLISFFADHARTKQLAAVFDTDTARNDLITRDGKVYVIAKTQSDLEWDKQIALRFPAAQRPLVTSVDDLREKSEQVLDQHNIDYFTILFRNIDEPELILVAHQGEDEETVKKRIAEITRLLKGVLPFAKGLHIREKTLSNVAGIAGSKLTHIPVTYSRIESGGYITFFINGYITDYALSEVSDLVKGFSHDWGQRKVRFGLVLNTTWLDGKSRQVGEDGYVLVDPSHWYFNHTINGN